MATATRRKYRFPTRQAAEDAVDVVNRELHGHVRLAMALYSSKVAWTRKRHGYRFGVFDVASFAGPRFVVCFDPGDQSPDLKVVDEDYIYSMERDAITYHRDQYSAAIRDGVTELRQLLRSLS